MNKNEKYVEDTKKSAMWFTVLPFTTQMARFINSLILARLLSPEAFGIIGIVSVLMYYSDTFSDFGFGKAIIQRKRVKELHFKSYFTFNLIISLLLFTLITYYSDNIAIFFEIEVLSDAFDVFAIYIVITAFLTPIKIKLSREIKYKTLAIIDAFRFGIQIPISLTLAINGFDFWSIIYAMIAGQLFALVVFLVINKGFILPTTKLLFLRTMFNFSKWDFVAGQANLLSESADKLFLAKILGASYVGLYDRAQGIAVMPYMQISQKLSIVSFSSFSRFQDSPKELDYYFGRLMSFQALLVIPMLLGLSSVSEPFVSSLLGEKWLEMIPTLKLMSFAFLIGALANPFSSLNTATGFISLQTKVSLLCLGVLLITLYNFTQYGINAVAYCLIMFQLLRLITNCIISKIKVNVSILFAASAIFPFLLAGILMFVSVRVVYSMQLTLTDWKYLVLLIATGASVYTLSVLFIPLQSSNFVRQKVKNAINRLKLKISH